MSFVNCVIDNDYEIYTEYPYIIRRKSNGHEVGEWFGHGYKVCKLNGRTYGKHRIIATQFLPNPDNLPEVDHINHDVTDYHIENLRWVNHSQNQKNQTKHHGIDYVYFDEIPAEEDDIIEVKDYGEHEFEDLYFANDYFYYYTGEAYRRLHINYKQTGAAFIQLRDVEGHLTSIAYSKFKRLYNLI